MGVIMQELILAVGLVAQTIATQTTPLQLERAVGAITIDGHIDEDAWTRTLPLPVETLQPVAGGVPTERTEFRVLYDDRNLWVSARMLDSDPATIMRGSPMRDMVDPADFFNLVLDTFNDDESAVVFTTTPSGRRADFAITNDGEGDSPMNYVWNAPWDVATKVDSLGWSVELRVPLSSLRYQVVDGRVVMGMILNRWIPRTRERIVFPPLDPNVRMAAFRPSRARDIVLSGLATSRPMYITPSMGARSIQDGRAAGRWSVDMKLQPTSRITADVTLHTDFSEAELDAISVNLTRERISLPELRPFFQERAGIFDIPLSDRSKLFYSRRIGLLADGTPLTVIGGGRLYGRAQGLDFGVMSTVAGPRGGRQCSTMLRARQSFDRQSYLGMTLLTQACDAQRSDVGVDGLVQLTRDLFLTGAIVAAHGEATHGPAALRLLLDRRSRIGPQVRIGLAMLDSAYEPALGLLDRAGTIRLDARLGYAFGGRPDGRIFSRSLFVRGERSAWDRRGGLDYQEIGIGTTIESRRGRALTAGLNKRREVVREEFTLPGNRTVPAGDYTQNYASVHWQSPRNTRLAGGATVTVGQFFGGEQKSVGTDLTATVSQRLNVGAGVALNAIERPGMRSLNAVAMSLRPALAIGTTMLLTGLLQYDTDSAALDGSVRMRWNLGEARDIWAIYNWSNEHSAPASIARRGAELKFRWMVTR